MYRVSILLLSLIATVFPALPPHLAGQQIEGLVNIKFQLDSRTFAVMVAINAAGFDLDSEAVQANPARKLAREHLSRLDSDLRDRLRQFYLSHDAEPDAVKQQSKYLSLALALTGPPEFALSLKPNEVPVDAQPIIGFERLVRETWGKGDLAALWDKVRPFYLQEIEIYRPLMRRAILQCLHYLRMEARVSLDREVVFAPELLNGYGIVNARNIGENYYLLVGPSRVMPRPTRGIRHEYLHFLIDPLIAKYADYLPEPSPFLSLVRQRPRAQSHLERDFPLVVSESLISMLEQRLDNTEDEEKNLQLIDSYEQGLILAPYFDDALEKFGRGRESFYEAVPAVLKGIQLEEEKRRPEEIRRLRAEIDARRAAARAKNQAETGARSELRGLLVRANEHLLAHRYDQARLLLEEVLRRDPDSASALYGLAQIAGREQDLERALSLYARAAAHAADENWIAGWSHVRRGNIYLFLDDLVNARKEWARVLELQGDLRGAKEAASEALARR